MGDEKKQLHVAMYPWLAMGHITPFLHLANQLASRGHKVSYLLPKKPILQLQTSNLYPNLIHFYPITIPPVPGLPPGTETASEIHISLTPRLMEAVDLTRPEIERHLSTLKPDLVFFDIAHWIPEIGSKQGFKTVCYKVVCAASLAIALVPAARKRLDHGDGSLAAAMQVPPPGYPSSKVVLHPHESHILSFVNNEFGNGLTFFDRVTAAMKRCDVISIRTCHEVEGQFCDYISSQYKKPVLLTGPVLPERSDKPLEDHWISWLDKFEPGSVVFCALGTQINLEKEAFQEIVLGFELTGLPFLVAVKPPAGAKTIEEALPEGFAERVGDRGVVYGGWVPQPEILAHESVGYFVSHCGFGSMWESLLSNCQIVLVPHLGDQILNTRLLADELKLAVEVERGGGGGGGDITKESLCKAIKSVMDEESEVGEEIKKNHAKWAETLTSPGFMSGYVDKFVDKLHELI